MEALFVYLLKSAGLLALFYGCYRLLFARETFFTSNRHFLLAGVLVSSLMPLYYLTKTIFVEPAVLNFSTSVSSFSQATTPITESFDWWLAIALLYVLGVLFFFARFCIQLSSLAQLLHKGTHTKKNGFTWVVVSQDTSPFSFFNYIVYNPKMHIQKELKTIIEHEKVHAKQKHSLDMLLMHLLCAFQWFNPIAWWYKKAAAQNLEFIADATITKDLNCKKDYQYILLNQSKSISQVLTIINPFFNSLIKKRIVMLNQQKSKPLNAFKYILILPFLALFLIVINTKTIAQTITSEPDEIETVLESISVDKNSTDFELDENAQFYKNVANIEIKFFNIKRNNSGEIVAIQSTFNVPDGKSGSWNLQGTTPITPFQFSAISDANKQFSKIGYNELSERGNINFAENKIGAKTELTSTKFKLTIDKNSTDAELKNEEDFFKKQYDIELRFFAIDRNETNEIISIKSTFKKDKGQSGAWNIKGDQPIQAFDFLIELDKDNKPLLLGYSSVEGFNSTNDFLEINDIKEESNTKKVKVSTTISLTIDKNSTDKELREGENFFKLKHKIDINFYDIKRNNQNEIIKFKSEFKDFMGNSGNYFSNKGNPIRPVTFRAEFNQDNSLGKIGYYSTKKQ